MHHAEPPRSVLLYRRAGWTQPSVHLLTPLEADAAQGTILRILEAPTETPAIRRLLEALGLMASVYPEHPGIPKGSVLDGAAAVLNWCYEQGLAVGRGIINLEGVPTTLSLEPWQRVVCRCNVFLGSEPQVSFLSLREAEDGLATIQAVLHGDRETPAARRLLDIVALSSDDRGNGGLRVGFDALVKTVYRWGIEDGSSSNATHS